MLKAVYSEANQCYFIMFGDIITDIDGKRFFESKKELKETLKTKGLILKGDNNIVRMQYIPKHK